MSLQSPPTDPGISSYGCCEVSWEGAFPSAEGTRSSPELHGAGDIGHLSSGVVGRCDAPSNGMLRVSVLYSTGSQDTIVEPVGYEEIRHPSLRPRITASQRRSRRSYRRTAMTHRAGPKYHGMSLQSHPTYPWSSTYGLSLIHI